MNRLVKPTSILALLSGILLAQNKTVIHGEDFETGGANFTSGNANMTFDIVADPDGAATQGMVGVGDLGIVRQRWGSITSTPNSITLPVGVEPGVSTFTASMKVFYPSDTTSTPPDRTGFILRWNGVNQQNSNIYYTKDDIPADTWTDLVLTDIIPATDANGAAVTSVTIIISFDDQNDDATAGTAVFIDDFSLEATVSADDPNLPVPGDFGFGEVDQNGGPIAMPLVLANSGTNNTLTVTAADLSGPSADLFSLSDVALPLDILPGESETLMISIDPGENLGLLTASLAIASNDPTTPNTTINLTATSVEPFIGKELIVNGDFETGNLEGWRQNARFNYSDAASRSGDGSGVFNLAGGAQWGEARTSIDNPDPVESIPITEEMIGKNYFYSAWYYRPSTGGPAENDTVQAIFRWNSKNPGNHTDGQKTVGSLPTDSWVRFTHSGIIPATDNDGLPVTHFVPLWSFQDVGSNATGGEIMYMDDISFKVDVPFIEPIAPLEITNLVVDTTNNLVTFNYNASIGANYAIDRSTTMLPSGQPGGWLEIEESITADEAIETYTDNGAPATSEVYFYRVRTATE